MLITYCSPKTTNMPVLSFMSLSFLFHLLLITSFVSQASADNNAQGYHYFCDFNKIGNYTPNSIYQTNLNHLFSTLVSNTEIDYGFYNFTYGQNTNRVNAIGLCRGDIKADECRSCLKGSAANLTQLCPIQKEAIGWYNDEKCMMRYSNRSIFNVMETGPAYFAWNAHNATQVDQFNKVVMDLLNNLRSKAASGDSREKYAAANVTGPENETIYGLVQCTPDLSGPQCDNCLNQSIKEIPHCCNSRIGARVVRPSCNLRYETSSLFYGPPADAASPSPSPLSQPPSTVTNNTSSEDNGNTSGREVTVVPLLLLLLFSFLFVCV